MDKLTPKQEAFALAYARLGVASRAYVEAYDTKKKVGDVVVRVNAMRLLREPAIQKRVRELHAASRSSALVDHDRLVQMYLEAFEAARESGDAAGMARATTDLAKLTGFMVEKSLNMNANVNSSDSYEEIVKRIEARAQRLGIPMPNLPALIDAQRARRAS